MNRRRSTGDLCVYPLIFGQCVGRIGCFLTGLDDHTHGNFTSLPWGVNFGDGPRHPTQLYEILFLLILGPGIYLFERSMQSRGARASTLARGALLTQHGEDYWPVPPNTGTMTLSQRSPQPAFLSR